MLTISIELMTSFSFSDVCNLITCICDLITVSILIIDFKRKKTEYRRTKPTQSLSVHRFSNKR